MLINGDVVRTGRHIFKLPEWGFDGVQYEEQVSNGPNILKWERHMRLLERILYVMASVNPALSYMQGFNELLPPFYYVLLQAITVCDNDIKMVEAISFFCLQELLTKTEIRDLYTTTDASSIILHKLNDFNVLLNKHLPRASAIIKSLGIHPLLYCYRWFNLMYSQEYELPVLLGLWDGLFTHFEDLVSYIYYVGIGHVHAVENGIIPRDYGATIATLQNLEIASIKDVLSFADKCWNEDHNVSKSVFSFSGLFGKRF